MTDKPEPKKKRRPIWLRLLQMLLAVVIGFSLVFAVVLLFAQHTMIYHPRPYEPAVARSLPREIQLIKYNTDQGAQTSFYLPPEDGPDRAPDFLWVCFNGNASLALDWMDLLEGQPLGRTGFLLIEYPEYGFCEGRASAKAILASSEAAYSTLAEKLNTTTDALDQHMGTLGFSIGSGTSLQFAVRHSVQRALLISPYTSLHDMAKITVPFPFYYLLLENYDNEARLRELQKLPAPPEVTILHGSADQIIPVRMGRKLGADFAPMAQYDEIKNADHNGILLVAEPQILQVLFAEDRDHHGGTENTE